ncbi:MAG: hypothetical protein JWP16_2399 [Alphaproteobacteria bacterium]|jgi:hypothetical protein|nr:hypothetical protein [Alphaproteobacteria bacterium]
MKRLLLIAAVLMPIAAPAAMAQPSAAEIIANDDKNGDKAIDRAEWAASPAPIPFPEEADTNKDGKIDQAELEALFAKGPPG